jgi:hypothetical protein
LHLMVQPYDINQIHNARTVLLSMNMNLKMHPIQFASIANLSEMKYMKVSCNRKHMIIQEFQDRKEL